MPVYYFLCHLTLVGFPTSMVPPLLANMHRQALRSVVAAWHSRVHRWRWARLSVSSWR